MRRMDVRSSLPWSTALAVLLFSCAVLAQNDNPLVQPSTRPAHVAVAAHVGSVVVSPGATVSLMADITPNPGIHVYAPGSKGYMPVALTIATSKDVTVGNTVD